MRGIRTSSLQRGKRTGEAEALGFALQQANIRFGSFRPFSFLLAEFRPPHTIRKVKYMVKGMGFGNVTLRP